MGKQKTRTIYRRSDTGEICKKDYAEKHPKTTEKEQVRIPPPEKKKK
jgi:hypothetical protein